MMAQHNLLWASVSIYDFNNKKQQTKKPEKNHQAEQNINGVASLNEKSLEDLVNGGASRAGKQL